VTSDGRATVTGPAVSVTGPAVRHPVEFIKWWSGEVVVMGCHSGVGFGRGGERSYALGPCIFEARGGSRGGPSSPPLPTTGRGSPIVGWFGDKMLFENL
jgi:hypothetical protein